MAPPPSSETKPVVSSDFPTTQWTLLAQATLHGDEKAAAALSDFCLRYRSPVIGVLRRRGLRDSRLEDVTHDFFIQLMQSSALKRADPQRGRFRQFLCGSLNRFLSDDADRHRAAKRGGGVEPLSLDAAPGGADNHALPEQDETPLLFDREWALSLIESALHAVEAEWTAAGKGARFAALRAFLPGDAAPPTGEQAGAAMGLDPSAVRSEVSRLRQRFRELLRAAVAATVTVPEDIDDELRHLHAILKSPGVKLPG